MFARALEAVAAWSLALGAALGGALLWWPTVSGWAGLCALLAGTWVCWLLARCADGERGLCGNVFHAAAAVTLASAAWHGLRDGLSRAPEWPGPLLGQFSGSLAVQVLLLSLLVVLSDELLRPRRRVLLGPLAAAFALGCGWGLAYATREACNTALTLGCASALAAAASWALRLGCGSDLETAATPLQAPPRWSLVLLRTACWLAVVVAMTVAAGVMGVAGVAGVGRDASALTWLGRGDAALAVAPAEASSWVLLSAALGMPAASALPLASAALAALRLFGGRSGCGGWSGWRDEAARCLGVLAAGGAMAAWLAPGGAFTPSINLLLGVSWSLLLGPWRPAGEHAPRPASPVSRGRSGWWMLAGLACGAVLLGLVRRMGLVLWILPEQRHRDLVLHGFFGVVITLLLLWQCSRWRFGWLAALLASLAVSAGGELAQRLWSMRSTELSDVADHLIGAGLALALYLLCRAARSVGRR